MEQAGFLLAHALWGASEGGGPHAAVLSFERAGERELLRLSPEQVEAGATFGQEWLATNPEAVPWAVLVYDGYVELPQGRRDALVLQAVTYGPPRAAVHLVLPFRPPEAPGGFGAGRPRVVHLEGVEQAALPQLLAALGRGLQTHQRGLEAMTKGFDPLL